MVEPTVATVFVAALVTALATGLGALPLLFVRSAGRVVLGASNAVAAGVMLAASLSLVLVPRGASIGAAAGWSIFSSLPQPLLAVPAFLFVDTFTSVLPVALGFAAGAMVWMVLGELLPEALHTAPARVVALAGGSAFALMLGFQLLLS